MLDFGEVKSRASIEDVATMLGLKLIKNGSQLRGPCPACNAGGERALVITPEKGLHYCFAKKAGGDQLALAAHIKNISVKDAASLISAHFGDGNKGTSNSTSTSTVTSPPKKGFDPDGYAARLSTDHPALADLGLSSETLKEWKSGYPSGGALRERLALRLNDRHGTCVGYIGYALKGEQPKISAPNGVSLEHIFGADRVKPGPLYLVREPIDVLKAYEAGVENVVSFLGDITPAALTMLTSLMDVVGNDSVELY